MPVPTDSALSASDVVRVLFRHKKKLVLVPLSIFLLGALVILFWPRTYRSQAKLFMQVGRESVGLDPSATTGQTISLQQAGREDEIKSAIDVITSRSVIGRAVDAVGPDVVLGRTGVGVARSNPAAEAIRATLGSIVAAVKSLDPVSDREEAIIRVERKLKADAERNSTVVVVEFDAKTPELAQAICDAIVTAYQQEHMRIHRNLQSSTFFTDQRDLLQQQLDRALAEVRDAKNEMGLATIEGQRSMLETQLGEVQLDTFRTQQELANAEARINDLRKQLDEIPARMVASKKNVPNTGRDLKDEQLYALKLKEMDLQARYSDAHPLLVAIRDQLREAEEAIGEELGERTETTDDVNPIHRQLSLDLKQQQSVVAGLQARLAKLREQQQQVLADMKAVNQHELRLDQLERASQIARTKYFKYAESLEQARIDNELVEQRISNVSVAQPATLAEKPVSPSKLLVGLASLLMATAGTGALVLASEKLNDKLRDSDDVQQEPEIPVLAAIPDDASHRHIFAK